MELKSQPQMCHRLLSSFKFQSYYESFRKFKSIGCVQYQKMRKQWQTDMTLWPDIVNLTHLNFHFEHLDPFLTSDQNSI